MYRDVRAADRMLARLSDLLRLTLESSDAQEVPLRDEVAFLEKYLHIEQIRLGDRLDVRFEIDPALEDALVPNLVLQPLVENAVKHGIAPRTSRYISVEIECRVLKRKCGWSWVFKA